MIGRVVPQAHPEQKQFRPDCYYIKVDVPHIAFVAQTAVQRRGQFMETPCQIASKKQLPSLDDPILSFLKLDVQGNLEHPSMLDHIQTTFTARWKERAAVFLVGIGGIGKTQLAQQFVLSSMPKGDSRKGKFALVLWISVNKNDQTKSSVEQALVDLYNKKLRPRECIY